MIALLTRLAYVYGVTAITITPDGITCDGQATPDVASKLAAARLDLARLADAGGAVDVKDAVRRLRAGEPLPDAPGALCAPIALTPAQRLEAALRSDPRLVAWRVERCTEDGDPDPQGDCVLIVAPNGRWQFLAPAVDYRLAERLARRFIAAYSPQDAAS